MKKLILITSLLITVASLSFDAKAQKVNISINVGTQPAWGPVGYDYAEYYYIPDINSYYIVNTGRFVYSDGGRWITARYLPMQYRNYDLYGMHKVVLVHNGLEPWRYNRAHYRDYARYRNYRGQSVIRDSRDARYVRSRNNRVAWYRENNVQNSNRPNRVSESRPNSRNNNNNRQKESVSNRDKSGYTTVSNSNRSNSRR